MAKKPDANYQRITRNAQQRRTQLRLTLSPLFSPSLLSLSLSLESEYIRKKLNCLLRALRTRLTSIIHCSSMATIPIDKWKWEKAKPLLQLNLSKQVENCRRIERDGERFGLVRCFICSLIGFCLPDDCD